MDLFEKRAMALGLSLVMMFFGLVVYAAKGLQAELPTCLPNARLFQNGRVVEVGPNRYQVDAVAFMWSFDMGQGNTIRIPRGATVDFYVTSRDVMHGYHIDKTLVNLMAIPGAVTYTRVKFDRAGEYQIVCHEYCGLGHQNMAGKVIVE
ncbi:MAG: cytochrome C oxidase subunit II [Armatimonadetes bacterium JP3_11]|nr:MAG: cytochrome C oxidase subunit II [Armatimonadetes bacterium JP3_11]RMH09598.1 MAG: cytochrome C oxidase subunit II [Armatimonadota bacterium]